MDKLSERQWKCLDAVRRVHGGEMTVGEAAQSCGLSQRQMRRVRRAVEERGTDGVVHGNTGREPWNKSPESLREHVVELFRTKYAGFNDHHFTEKLEELEGVAVSRSNVQRWLRAAGLPAARRHRPPRHRRRRERRQQTGVMLLWDGSKHAWLEGRGPKLCLVAALDDATSEMLPGAHFVDEECSAGYLKLLLEIARSRGLPWSIYMDQHSIFRRNDDHWTLEEELRGEQDPTQVLRAMKALGIEVIYALSPQAKGRVERVWGTYQDRLVSELRLAGAKTKTEANAVLERVRPQINARVMVAPADAKPAWRRVRREIDLERVCSFCYEATVLNDNTVRLGGKILDIPAGPRQRSYAKARVEVRQLLDGCWRVYYRNSVIANLPATEVVELRALRVRKRPAASKAFRKSLVKIAASLP
jgi:transposase